MNLQARISNLLRPSTFNDAVSCGLPAAASEYFIDLRLITHLIRASWPRVQDLLEIPEAASSVISQDHHRGQQQQRDGRGLRRTAYDVPPLDAKTCAALLTTADRLFQCQQPQLLTEQLRHLLGYDQRPPARVTWTRQILVGKPDCSPGLRHAFSPLLQTYGPLAPGRMRGALQAPVRGTRYKPEHIAQFLHDDWYQRFFAPMRGINPLHLRRAAAIHLCQIAAGGSVVTAAQFLGIPAGGAQKSIKLQRTWARNNSDLRQFETALHELADELDSAPHLIDYKRRREALRRWCIDPDTWTLLATQPGAVAAHAGNGESSDRQRQIASILVWARVTQGEYRLAPRLICDRLPPGIQSAWQRSTRSAESPSQAGQAARHQLDPRVLDAYADTLAGRIDRGEDP